uniref:Carboxylic ester hydrolase n=1 Tax=Scylla paramamosain TaxID=85552 RepID=A0A3S5X9D9_SCYPA|nr:juvenile hormone esterase like 7 [Scylla paramamosain]
MKLLAAVLVAAAVMGVARCGLQVVTEGGRIQGAADVTVNGRTFNSFYSIPYARAPIGGYRFKDPVKPITWQRLADATRMPPKCLQVPFFDTIIYKRLKPEEVKGSENCLFLNVFTPVVSSTPEKAKLPVMVWLHGGAFYSGAADEYLPHALLDQDVVLVVVQYRLGVLGFLSTEDSVMPGNLGLKDQTMALQWVQRNIHLFGGDKKRVTIFGESAGGASVHYHMLSPKSRGLFSQVIMQSGNALQSWALNNRHREEAERLGRNMGCEDVQNSTALLACLQKIDAKELTAAIQDTFQWFVIPIIFSPRVDGDYLPDFPANLIAKKLYSEVDLVAGVTKDEGAMATRAMFVREDLVTQVEKNFTVTGPLTIGIENEKDSASMAKTLYDYYMSDINFDAHSSQFTQLYSDMTFNFYHDEITARHAAHFPGRRTFRYEFQHTGEVSLSDAYGTEKGNHWVGHGDELFYLFAGGTLFEAFLKEGLTQPDDLHVRDMMVKMWTNFATSGNPTPDASLGFKWEPSTADNLHYLAINTSPSMQPDSRKETRDFFASLPISNLRMLYAEQQQQQPKQQEQQQRTKTARVQNEL